MITIISPLPPRSHLARFFARAGANYDRMTVISELARGRKLLVQGWLGEPFRASQWHQLQRAHFPKARGVTWERRDPKTGQRRRVTIPLRAPRRPLK